MRGKIEYHNITNKGTIKLFEYIYIHCVQSYATAIKLSVKNKVSKMKKKEISEKLLCFKKIAVLSKPNNTDKSETKDEEKETMEKC